MEENNLHSSLGMMMMIMMMMMMMIIIIIIIIIGDRKGQHVYEREVFVI
jgi:hypothetical protein